MYFRTLTRKASYRDIGIVGPRDLNFLYSVSSQGDIFFIVVTPRAWVNCHPAHRFCRGTAISKKNGDRQLGIWRWLPPDDLVYAGRATP